MPDNDIIVQKFRENGIQLKRISSLTELNESVENLNNIINDSYLLLTDQERTNNYKIKCSLFLSKIYNKINEIIEEIINTSGEDISNITELSSKVALLTNKLNNLLSTYNTDLENIRSKINLEKSNILANVYNKSQVDNKLQTLANSFITTIENYISEHDVDFISNEEFNEFKNEISNSLNNQIDELATRLDDVDVSLQAQIDRYDSNLSVSYYDKDEIRLLLLQLKGELSDELINQWGEQHSSDLSSVINTIYREKANILNTVYTRTVIDKKFQDLNNDFVEFIEDYIDDHQDDFVSSSDFEIFKSEINASLQNKINDLSSAMTMADNNLQSQIDRYNSNLSTSYYTKDEIRTFLLQMKGELSEELMNELISQIDHKFESEVVETFTNKVNEIVDELNTQNNSTFANSRIDKLEAYIKYLEDNGGINPIDPINRIEWSGYSIVNPKSEYIIGESFEIIKGTVTVYYNDGTSEDITSQASFNVSGGSLSGNTISIGNSEGNHSIKVSYNNHQSNQQMTYKVIAPKYYNYFLLVDRSHLELITNNFNAYYIEHSTGCPISESHDYIAHSLIIQKFYNNIDQELYNEDLYMIIPKQYARVENTKLYINNKPLKSNIFEISGLSIYQEITVNEPCFNISDYSYKEISYYIIHITDSINKGIQLNY